jgi:GDP-L-fucose synthase
MISKPAKIFIAGHRGMVGSAILRRLQSAGYSNLITRTRQELDLLDQRATFDFLQGETEDSQYQNSEHIMSGSGFFRRKPVNGRLL